MPTLSITITNAVATRIQNAYGANDLADLKSKVINQIKTTVIGYETSLLEEIEEAKVQTAKENKQTAIETALSTAETDIQLT